MPSEESGILRDVVVAVCGALTGLVAALPLMLRNRAQRAAQAGAAPSPHSRDYSAEIAALTQSVEHLEQEVERVRTRIHDIASHVGAAAMVPSMMGTLTDLRERVARMEGKL